MPLEPTAELTPEIARKMRQDVYAGEVAAAGVAFAEHFPLVGAFVAAAHEVLEERRRRRLYETLAELEGRLRAAEARLDRSQADQRGITDFFEAWLDRTEDTPSRLKRSLLVNLAASAIATTAQDFDEATYFTRVIGELEDVDVKCLLRMHDRTHNHPFPGRIGGIQKALYDGSMQRLASWELVETQITPGRRATPGVGGSPAVERIEISKLGVRFMDVCFEHRPNIFGAIHYGLPD